MKTLVDAVLDVAETSATDQLAPAVLIAGCTSDAGKSLVVTALCAALRERELRVAPFKAQNMSNNAAVTTDGGEIGRAQYVQAQAAGIPPTTQLNPVLLKPSSDRRSQLVVHGQAQGEVGARDYFPDRRGLLELCVADLQELRRHYDIVLCEGAGSPAEVNLRASDLSNFGLAEAADIPVIVVGDIDRGGVLAHFVGTANIVDPADRARIRGFIVNKFRGDESLLEPGLTMVEERTGIPVLGVLPFVEDYWYGAEDSLQSRLGERVGVPQVAVGSERLTIAAVRYPRLSNATDVEALSYEPGVDVFWAGSAGELEVADAVVLPGSKDTLGDLEWLRERGLDYALRRVAASGRAIVGLCGGYQMLGEELFSAEEGAPVHQGLGLLPISIRYGEQKTVQDFVGRLAAPTVGGILGKDADRLPVCGYEIHEGQCVRNDAAPLLMRENRGEGSVVGLLWGTHCHGLFHNDALRHQWLMQAAEAAHKPGFQLTSPPVSSAAVEAAQLELLRHTIEHCPAR